VDPDFYANGFSIKAVTSGLLGALALGKDLQRSMAEASAWNYLRN
jgi:hypothetical protein